MNGGRTSIPLDPLRFLEFPCCVRLRKTQRREREWNDTVLKSLFAGCGMGAHRGSEPACNTRGVTANSCAFPDCAGCGRDIKNGQALLALDKQWHLGCFKCKSCGKVLTGEYISK
ncbi:hypothetical protein GH733_001175 [Mirounga leonina]|nr:hypothetical protein GH733_001175 [Mirounga leonina]